MKKFIVLLGLLAFAGGVSSAQTKGFTYGIWTQGSMGRVSLNGHREFGTMDLSAAAGYAFSPSIYLRLQLDATYGMWDYGAEKGGKTWRENGSLGPTIGYNFYKNPAWGIVDVAATVGNSLYFKSDWSYMFYDLSFNWAFPFLNRNDNGNKMRVFVGMGVRYYDTHNSNFDNYCNLYAKVGFRFN